MNSRIQALCMFLVKRMQQSQGTSGDCKAISTHLMMSGHRNREPVERLRTQACGGPCRTDDAH